MSKPKTASQANFAQTVHASIQRSTFLRPSSLKTTFNCGELVPVYIDEVLPGDTRKIDLKMLARLSTPLFPTMDNIDLEFYAFFVPNRIVWDGWEQLNGENKTGAWVQSPDPALVPVWEPGVGDELQISKRAGDYYGIPVGMDCSKYGVSCLPFRGYTLIYNEWFRDENLQAPIPFSKGNTFGTYASGSGVNPNSYLISVNKFHDYFTSALPAPQKGSSPLIPIELNELIPVITGLDNTKDFGGLPLLWRDTANTPIESSLGTNDGLSINQSGNTQIYNLGAVSGGSLVHPSNLYADGRGMQINATTISELRTQFQILKLYEKDARGGTRYIEMLKAHFGVDAGDYRLQRPEFLGHYKTMVGIQSVPQTSASVSGSTPQGNLAAYSLTVGSSTIVNKTFVEHGFIHIFAVARQVKTYQQGLEKFWSRRERFDFYYPTLAHISEQPILNKEIYALGNDGDEVFGYQEAWADYRYKPNRVSGQMRSGVTNSLDAWHYADIYDSMPVLSNEWIVDNSAVNVNRTLAVSMSEDDQIRMDIEFMDKATRPMPVYSIPGLVDHF